MMSGYEAVIEFVEAAESVLGTGRCPECNQFNKHPNWCLYGKAFAKLQKATHEGYLIDDGIEPESVCEGCECSRM